MVFCMYGYGEANAGQIMWMVKAQTNTTTGMVSRGGCEAL